MGEPRLYVSLDNRVRADDQYITIWDGFTRTTDGIPTKKEVADILASLLNTLEFKEIKEVLDGIAVSCTQARYYALPKTIDLLGEVLTLGEFWNTDTFVYQGQAPFHVEVQLSSVNKWSVTLDLDQEHGIPEDADSFETLETCLIQHMKRHRDTLNMYLERVK